MTTTNRQPTASTPISLRILAVHRYYWPDTPPYAAMLKRIVGQWHLDGHNVEVLSSQPSYKASLSNVKRPKTEHIDGVQVDRLSLSNESGRPFIRISNSAKLSFSLLWRALTRRYDVIMISTAPPVVGGFCAALAAKLTGARFIYHCMDIHPEVGKISGEFSSPVLFKLLQKMDNWSCSQANPVVVLSQDMEDSLRERPGGNGHKIEIINNFSLPTEATIPPTLPFRLPQHRLKILFAGNIGRFQGLGMVIEAMALLKQRNDIEFIFMGDGTTRLALEKEVKLTNANVRFIGHQSIEIAKATMQRVDLGFVSLIPSMYRYAYPSKTMTYLEQGCPLIVAAEPQSQLSREVITENYGFCISSGDSQELAKLLIKLADDQKWKEQARNNALQKFSVTFSEGMVLRKWHNLIKLLDSKD